MGARTTIEALAARAGEEVAVSRWFTIDQALINAFADITHDHQFIDVDPAAAAKTPFKTTIAHGFLTLSMLSAMAIKSLPEIQHHTMGVNYGSTIRFLTPVRSGSKVRARFTLRDATSRTPGEWVTRYAGAVDMRARRGRPSSPTGPSFVSPPTA